MPSQLIFTVKEIGDLSGEPTEQETYSGPEFMQAVLNYIAGMREIQQGWCERVVLEVKRG